MTLWVGWPKNNEFVSALEASEQNDSTSVATQQGDESNNGQSKDNYLEVNICNIFSRSRIIHGSDTL